MSVRILIGDVRDRLRELPSDSVDCVVTSPPYWGLRDYGTGEWEGGDEACPHAPPEEWIQRRILRNATLEGGESGARAAAAKRWFKADGSCPSCGARRRDLQIGLEPSWQSHVETIADIFDEVRRVLKKEGTLWLNYGDSYATSVNGRSAADTKATGNDDRTFRDKPFSTVGGVLKPKDLCGIPWRVAFALQERGWWLRQDIIWSKPNPMPESIRDRCTKAHEYLFLLSKSPRYYFDAAAIAEPLASSSVARLAQDIDRQEGSDRVPGKSNGKMKAVYTKPYTGTSTKDYAAAGAQDASATKARIVEKIISGEMTTRNKRSVWEVTTQPFSEAHFATFPPQLIEPCILAGCPSGGTVLDPFFGAGTTGLVADRLGRNAIGIELNPQYAEMAMRRIQADSTLFADVSIETTGPNTRAAA